jgi:hypothetical protein
MATEIDKNNLPDTPKRYLELSKTDIEMSVDYDDQYLIRILIDKVNELTREINTIKDELAGE